MRDSAKPDRALFCILLACAIGMSAAGVSIEGATVVEAFDRAEALARVEAREAACRIVPESEGPGGMLETVFEDASRPTLVLRGPEQGWNWADAAGVAIAVTNPNDTSVEVEMTVFGTTDTGAPRTMEGKITVPPNGRDWVRVYFSNEGRGPYWGMHGIPVMGPVSRTLPGVMTVTRLVTASSVTLVVRNPGRELPLLFDNLVTFEEDSSIAHAVPLPFVDRFGQFIHEEWPGKVHDEEELLFLHQQELAELESAPALPQHDRFGGWADGPQVEATGWFRTEKRNGKWWLVTPEGRLFLSWGVNCIYPGDVTFVTGREDWFEWIPEREGPFGDYLGRSGSFIMADAIGGEGETLGFYALNQQRKHGKDWQPAFRSLALKRIRAWGFNTVANWSRQEVLEESTLPFTVTTGTRGGRMLEASAGYWGQMMDVFDPAFPERVDTNIQRAAAPFADNPLVVGYFVDNEMSWVDIAASTLACPPDQPARVVFIDRLQGKYATLDALNDAWGITAASWDDVRLPDEPTEASKLDADEFEYAFGYHYFRTIADALDKYAPNQLYLGCRFTPFYCPRPVLEACADVVDVVSINFYLPMMPPSVLSDLDKPAIIGEFHFGALDRGMFHTGLQAADNQDHRGQLYAQYVRSIAEHPVFVGAHWFQYTDQPLTGRSLDGENYSIGLVSGVDVPHETFLEYVKKAHAEVYELRDKQ